MSLDGTQQDVGRFLSELSGSRPRETHISAVFIGADTVWKLKKAVRLPFLDFTTVAARRHFLRRELELNKPAAPGIYRDIRPIVRRPDGGLALGDPDQPANAHEADQSADWRDPDQAADAHEADQHADASRADNPPEAIDWVLCMAPVAEYDFLDVIATGGRLIPRLLDQLGDCVAKDHAERPAVSGWDSAGALLRISEGNAQAALAAHLPQPDVEAWRTAAEARIRALSAWLADRAAAGFVRRCHGDLHLGNLCLWDGVPVPFDALEFDEAMATIDTAYDLAFLLMDLDHRVDRLSANRVMNRYFARSGDVAAVRGLPLFLSERAMIRAHVAAASAHPEQVEPYLAAAQAYLSAPPPLMLAIGGLPGSGKSTLARLLAPELGAAPGAVVLRSDEIRKRLFGVAPEVRLPEAAYNDDANARVNSTLMQQARQVADAGHAVILDATFIAPDMRQAAGHNVSVPFLGIWLDVPLSQLEGRIMARRDDASDATVSVLRRASGANAGPVDWLIVDGSDQAKAAAAIRHAVGLLRSQ